MKRVLKYLSKGSVVTFVISTLLVTVLFGDVISNINNKYFGGNGDGLKAYYTATYHVKHDSSYFHFEGMNYPYGDHVFFTGNQNVITNTIKVMKPIVDLSDYTVGIMNSVMLLSIIFCALLLFLILKELDVDVGYAIVFAIGITFLSPQLWRLPGHYTLSFVFVIPFVIYQLIRYQKLKKWRNTIYLFVGLSALVLMHPYFFPIAAILILTQFGVLFFYEKKEGLLLKFTHLFIQLFLPVIVFQLLLKVGQSVDDRTAMPWGFWEFTSNSSGVFYPFGMPYEFIFHSFIKPMQVSWEGMAYVGIVPIFGLIAMFLKTIWKTTLKLFKKTGYSPWLLKHKQGKTLLWLFLAGVLGLAISFAFPFNLGLHDWVDSFGFIKQFRSIGRMNWLFFYTVNIVVIVWVLTQLQSVILPLKRGILILAIAFLFVDAGYHIVPITKAINNENPSFSDYNYSLPDNEWLKNIDFNKYQAILPLPYFHVGSENINVFGVEPHRKYVLNVSLLTGLPTTGSYLSRTSISQSLKNVQMHQKPYKKLKILTDFNTTKSFLIIADSASVSEGEKDIIRQAHYIGANSAFQFYEISFQKLAGLYKTEELNVKNQIKELNNTANTYFTSDSSVFVFESFEKEETTGYFDKGSYKKEITGLNELKTVKYDWIEEGEMFKVSFWINIIDKDLMLRAGLEVWQIEKDGTQHVIDYRSMGDHIIAIDGTWGLFEVEYIAYPGQEFVYFYKNNSLKDKSDVEIDAFLIRKSNTDVYYYNSKYFMKNNRYFSY